MVSFTGKNVKQHDTATKHLVIRNKIEQHDFDIKVKTVLKWLAKGYDVHIVLQNVTKGEGKNVVWFCVIATIPTNVLFKFQELISDSLKNILQKKGILEKLNKNEKEWKLIVHPINEQSDSDVSTLLEPTVSNKLT